MLGIALNAFMTSIVINAVQICIIIIPKELPVTYFVLVAYCEF